jgi:hypothetical protein
MTPVGQQMRAFGAATQKLSAAAQSAAYEQH